MKIKIKRLHTGVCIPKKATTGAGCYDLYTCKPSFIGAKCRTVVGLGFAMELPDGFVADIRPRSGYSAKGFADQNARRRNADVLLGTIDSDYRGEVGVIVENKGNAFQIDGHQRIAQMLIHRAETVTWQEAELTETGRGAAGSGSTGV